MWKLFGLHYILVRDLCTLLIGNNVRAQHRRNMRRTAPRQRRRSVDTAPWHRRRTVDAALQTLGQVTDANAPCHSCRATLQPPYEPRRAVPRLATATALEKALRAAVPAHLAQAHLRACARGGTTFLHGSCAGMKAGQVNLFSSIVLCDFRANRLLTKRSKCALAY